MNPRWLPLLMALVVAPGCAVICGAFFHANEVAMTLTMLPLDSVHEIKLSGLRDRVARGDGVAALQLAAAYAEHAKGHLLRVARAEAAKWRKRARDANGTVSVPFRDGRMSFLKRHAAGEFLAAEDAFVKTLSPFDRSARLQTARVVGQKEYLKFVHEQARDWTLEEMVRLRGILEEVSRKLGGRKLPWPEEIFLIKTTGHEEANAAYTRGRAVILPESKLKLNDERLQRLLVHELFHVLSRANPGLATQLYRIIGYKPSPQLNFPAELRALKITNPDAPFNRHAIEVEHGGAKVRVMPILYSRGGYNEKIGGVLFRYLVFRLLVLDTDDPLKAARNDVGKLILLMPGEAKGFREKIGGNTGYIIHPEETMADNFVFLVLGKKNLPNPEIVRDMDKVFRMKRN